MLSKKEVYQEFKGWTFEKLEGGLNLLIFNMEELIHDFDTLVEKLLLEGILLHGQELEKMRDFERLERTDDHASLLDLVRSL